VQNIGFSDSGYVIKPPQPSSTVHNAPPFLHGTCFQTWESNC